MPWLRRGSAHAIMNLGLSEPDRAAIRTLFAAATGSATAGGPASVEEHCGELPPLGAPGSSYMLANPEEFFAEATQAWFGASSRTDVVRSLR